jgi:hypothetical protein
MTAFVRAQWPSLLLAAVLLALVAVAVLAPSGSIDGTRLP